jgi:hypothetical protein
MTQVGAGWMWGDESFSWFQVDAIVDVVIAAATFATLVWAVVTTTRAEKRAEDAEGRERERERAAERAQASRVTVYKGRNQSMVPTSFGRGGTLPVLKVNNASDQPIFAVTVHGSVLEGGGMMTLHSETSPSAPPGDVLDFALSPPRDGILSAVGLLYAEEVALVAVVFRDANEVNWLRTETGRLVPMPDDEEAAGQLLAASLAEQWTTEARTRYAQKISEAIEGQEME